MRTITIRNDGNVATVEVEGVSKPVRVKRPPEVGLTDFLVDFPVGKPVHPTLTVQFLFPPWMWVDGQKLMVTGGQFVSDPGQPKLTTHPDCLSGCHDTAEGAWHDFPCRHFLNAIRIDSDLLYDPETGEMVPRSEAN